MHELKYGLVLQVLKGINCRNKSQLLFYALGNTKKKTEFVSMANNNKIEAKENFASNNPILPES